MANTSTDGKLTKLGSVFLEDMVSIGAGIIATSADIPTEQAEQIAYDLTQSLTKHWGGSILYVPKTNPDKIAKRNMQIWQNFKGNNQHQLAQKYGLSTITIYQILAEVRKSLPKIQEDLFNE